MSGPNGQEHPFGRVRITRVQITVEAWVDRGVALDPLPIEPLTYTVAQWPQFDLDEVQAQAQAQVDAGAALSPEANTAGV